MSMEIATRFITLRESGEDTAALALLTDNATLGTVWGCINGKEAIANYFKDEKRFTYLKKQYGPLKQLDDSTCYRIAVIRRNMAEHMRIWADPSYRETFFVKNNRVRLVIFEKFQL